MGEWKPTPKQAIVAELLAVGETVEGSARKAGVSRRIVYVWRQTPEFLAYCAERYAETWQRIDRRLTAAIDMAAGYVAEQIDRLPPEERLDLARWLLDRQAVLLRGPQNPDQSGFTVSQSVSGSPADVAEFARLLDAARDARSHGLVEPPALALEHATADIPSN